MLRGRRAAVAAALATAAVAAVTAGCGGGSTSSALSLDPVAAAATKTQDAGAARIRFALAIGSSQLQGKTIRIHGTGVLDGTSAQMSFKFPSLAGQLGPGLRQLRNAAVKEVALEQDGDYVMYTHLGFLTSELPGGKQWIKLDISKLGKSAGVDLGKLMAGSQLSPTDLLGMLKSEGAKVQKLGTANVGGTTATHYRVRVDVAKALKAKGLTSPLFSSVATKMKTLSEDVWIGKDGLVRRIELAYGRLQGGSPRLAMTMNLFDYGAHVSIAAPPSGDVFDATQFAQQGIGSRFLR